MPGGRGLDGAEHPDPSGPSVVLFGIDTDLFGIETLTFAKPP
jgi:hypothetical protein